MSIIITSYYESDLAAEVPELLPGKKLWYRGDALSFDGSDRISQATEKFFGVANLIQLTPADQPLRIAGGLNGHDTIRHDGVTEFLEALFADIAQPTTMYFVFAITGSTGANQVLTDGSTADRQAIIYTDAAGDLGILSSSTLLYSKAAPFGFIYASLYFDGANSEFFENGVSKVSGNVGAEDIMNLVIGDRFDGTGARAAKIDWAEYILYDQRHSVADRVSMQNYFSTRYAL